MSEESMPEGAQVPVQAVEVNYEKSPSFRTIHVDGVFGGSTPRGMIQMALFNERTPIPQQTVHALIGGVLMGKELTAKRSAKKGIFREIDINAVFDLGTAKIIHSWLGEHIVKLEAALAEDPDIGRVFEPKGQGDEH